MSKSLFTHTFDKPLLKARILSRPNRFIIMAELEGETVKAHCPVSGRIGALTVDGLPCLLSGPYENRGTEYTIEAFALENELSRTFQWVGINQNAMNRYVGGALKANALTFYLDIPNANTIIREQTIGASRLDFKVNANDWLEIKSPLLEIHAFKPEAIPKKMFKAGDPSKRLPRQLRDLISTIPSGGRGALLVNFQYDNTRGTSLKEQVESNVFPDAALNDALKLGLEEYVLTWGITQEDITLKSVIKYA